MHTKYDATCACRLGKYHVTVNVSNALSYSVAELWIFVLNETCSQPTIKVMGSGIDVVRTVSVSWRRSD